MVRLVLSDIIRTGKQMLDSKRKLDNVRIAILVFNDNTETYSTTPEVFTFTDPEGAEWYSVVFKKT